MKKTYGLIVALVFLGILLAGCTQSEITKVPATPQDSNIGPQAPAQENDNVKENDFVETPTENLFESPIENYALSLEDLKPGYFEAEEFSGYIKEEDAFESEDEKEKAIERGWLESYQVLFQREVSANVLLEDIIVKHELTLYDSIEGAQDDFADWKQTVKDTEGFTVLSAPKKGEESIAYRFELEGEIEGEFFTYSPVSFRTKNIIHTVLVGGMYGSNVKIDNAIAYADIVLGKFE